MRWSPSGFIIFLLGCAHDYGPALRTRFANEEHCMTDDVAVYEIGAGGWRVRGCGREVDYVCRGACSRESDRRFDDAATEAPSGGTVRPGEPCQSHVECAGAAYCDPGQHVCISR